MSTPARIQARTLKGFRDHLPESMIPRERLIETAKSVYRSFGFQPIDTPALEYTEVLLAKAGGETEKQLYRFEDQGGRDVALRFDLTVPFARFAAQHIGQIGTPFRRYHVGPVWRGENTGRGRYREFVQCDFDVIGTESSMADTEVALVIHELFRRIGFERFTLHINNRNVLNGLLETLGLEQHSVPVLRALDKADKVGAEAVTRELLEVPGIDAAKADEIYSFSRLGGEDNDALLDELAARLEASERGRRGVQELRELCAGAYAGGVPPERLRVDVSIARGLDYYTGTVYETFLDDLADMGSCCSGGRYDDLASAYTKERLPGVGASLGLDRLLAAMQELDLIDDRLAAAPIFLAYFEAERGNDYLALAARLRAAELGVEFYPEPRKLKAQLRYADRRGHRLALIVGSTEFEAGTCQLKDLARQTSEEVPLENIVDACRTKLAD